VLEAAPCASAVAHLVEHVYTNCRRLFSGIAVEAKDPHDDR
jgi:hypothetical protein